MLYGPLTHHHTNSEISNTFNSSRGLINSRFQQPSSFSKPSHDSVNDQLLSFCALSKVNDRFETTLPSEKTEENCILHPPEPSIKKTTMNQLNYPICNKFGIMPMDEAVPNSVFLEKLTNLVIIHLQTRGKCFEVLLWNLFPHHWSDTDQLKGQRSHFEFLYDAAERLQQRTGRPSTNVTLWLWEDKISHWCTKAWCEPKTRVTVDPSFHLR